MNNFAKWFLQDPPVGKGKRKKWKYSEVEGKEVGKPQDWVYIDIMMDLNNLVCEL